VLTPVLAAEGSAVANEVVTTTSGAVGIAWLIPVVPFVGFLLVLALTRSLMDRVAYIATGASAVSFLLSLAVGAQMVGSPATYVRPLPAWITVGALDVAYDLYIDQLTVTMLLVVTGIALLIHIYSIGYMEGDARYERYFAYLNLFVASMLILVLGSNLLTLFLGWELVGLSSYLLIGFWFEQRPYAAAAKKAFITNRVGDVSFMIGMFLAFTAFGTLTFTDIFAQTDGLATTTAFALILLLFGGAAAKSAQIPLYVWLPDAMAGPTPVSALIHAATMVTAGVYLMVRMSPVLVVSVPAMTLIAWIGALTALLAALIAMRQNDIKKVLAYSTVSQLGYMFIAVGVGAFRESIFHLVTHAFFKGLLFLAAGSVMHAMANRTDIWRMGGLRRAMPITFWTALTGWLAISGVPPFAGFFSKDQILNEAYLHGYGAIYVIGILVAVLTAFYMSRWFFLIFLGEPRFGRELHPHESPRSMTVPLLVLAVASTIGGMVLNPVHRGWLYNTLEPTVGDIADIGYAPAGPLQELVLVPIAIAAAILGIAVAYLFYVRADVSVGELAEPIRGPIADLEEHAFYVDAAYESVFVRFGGALARGLAWVDANVVDGLVRGAGAVAVAVGRTSRGVQTGLVRSYVAAFLAGALALVAVVLVQVR
jgi:NADH-quinone oxidoreductase subunit L